MQFQRYVPGVDLRVHTVAGEAFATRVDTDRVDYRYARLDGGRARFTPFDLPDELAERCVSLAARLGLDLAGIDLILPDDPDDGGPYCLEVNPSPAFSYYESLTGQPISRAIAHALERGQGVPAG
ncbi:ATP-grasp domain-containing protein [Actinacidiphila yeochonensis]|uniref:ATP-grasp domain-containing protein n=1 Tax=Actinacidiphila yeochonensis TaxID=89050 RepID=UPI00068A10B9|nr:hypothetical protein [Actinacidiphila yeochonensis]